MESLPIRRDFSIVVAGTSAHGATPHLGRDAIVAASAITVQLQTVVSRVQDPLQPLKLVVRTVRAGKEYNIICGFSSSLGSLRWDSRRDRSSSMHILSAFTHGMWWWFLSRCSWSASSRPGIPFAISPVACLTTNGKIP